LRTVTSKNLIYGEVYQHGKVDIKTRELINLVVATTNQTMDEVRLHTKAALSVGLKPAEIKEAIYQCGAYIGLGKAQSAVVQVNKVFREKNIKLPVESQKQLQKKAERSTNFLYTLCPRGM
jgi:4-carboxymuconolactone decarboxylase